MPKTMPDLDELEAAWKAATQGEWECDHSSIILKGSGAHVGCPPQHGAIASLYDGEYIENDNAEADARLIVLAINSLPALWAEIQRLRAENARLQRTNDYVFDWMEECGFLEPFQEWLSPEGTDNAG